MLPATSNLDNIQTKIKKMVILMAILLGLGVIVLIILLISNSTKSNSNKITIQQQATKYKLDFGKNCAPINITYKDNYISLSSKSCAIIKIITPNGKITSYHY